MQSYKREGLRNTPDRRSFTLTTSIKSISPARRKIHRRLDESPNAQLDWYHSLLFVQVMGIVTMSVADAVFTLKLISAGAIETNPVMGYLINISVPVFVSAKMLLTSCGVVLLTALSSYLFLNRFLVSRFITVCFIGYIVLISSQLLVLSAI